MKAFLYAIGLSTLSVIAVVGCSTQIAQFENKSRTESFDMGDAPYVGLFFILGDSPGDKLLQGSEAFFAYIDGFADQLVDPTKTERYCVQFTPASAAYNGSYGADAFPDSYRLLDRPVCNFNEVGRETNGAVIKAAFRRALSKNNAGHSVQQFLGSFLRVFEANDPNSNHAAFVKDYSGKFPSLYIVTTMGVTTDNTPSETFDENHKIFLPSSLVQSSVLQQSLAHLLNEPGTPAYYNFQNMEPGTPVCDRAQSLVNPLCVCDIVGPMCMYWLYRNNYPLMTPLEFKTRITQYIENMTGIEAPTIVMATVGIPTILETMGFLSSAYLSAPNMRMHQIVKSFNEDQPEANAVCSGRDGLEGQCSWSLGAGGAQHIFDVAQDLGERSFNPVVLSLPVDTTKPLTVTLSTNMGAPRVLNSSEYVLVGRRIEFVEAVKTQIRQARVGAHQSIRVTITVDFTPAPKKEF